MVQRRHFWANVQHDKTETYFLLMDDVFHRENKPKLSGSCFGSSLKLVMQRDFHSFGMSEDAKCEFYNEQILTSVI